MHASGKANRPLTLLLCMHVGGVLLKTGKGLIYLCQALFIVILKQHASPVGAGTRASIDSGSFGNG